MKRVHEGEVTRDRRTHEPPRGSPRLRAAAEAPATHPPNAPTILDTRPAQLSVSCAVPTVLPIYHQPRQSTAKTLRRFHSLPRDGSMRVRVTYDLEDSSSRLTDALHRCLTWTNSTLRFGALASLRARAAACPEDPPRPDPRAHRAHVPRSCACAVRFPFPNSPQQPWSIWVSPVLDALVVLFAAPPARRTVPTSSRSTTPSAT